MSAKLEKTAAYWRQQAEGCLLGYVAEADGPDGGMYRYAIFIADPDDPGHWSEDQANGLKNLEGGTASEKTVPLPLTRGVKAKVLTVKGAAGGRYISLRRFLAWS